MLLLKKLRVKSVKYENPNLKDWLVYKTFLSLWDFRYAVLSLLSRSPFSDETNF